MTLSWGLRDAWTLDNFHKISTKSFTFDNGRTGIQSVVSQLDRCYVLTRLDDLGGRIGVSASLRNMLDHSHVSLWIRPSHVKSNSSTPIFDLKLLKDLILKADLIDAWNNDDGKPILAIEWAI
jgi:hypothetical protein